MIKDISSIRKKKVEEERQKNLDLNASIASIENCLKFLNMNKLTELEALKEEMKKTIKNLKGKANG